MKPIALLLTTLALTLPIGCQGVPGNPASEEITVFAAASLHEALSFAAGRFEQQHPGVKIILNFAGSQQLAQQLAQGAQADVFVSANLQQMENAVAAGRVEAKKARLFAENRLVIIFPKDGVSPLRSVVDLSRPELKLVIAAEEVPAGGYTQEFLRKAAEDPEYGESFQDAVLRNVVSYEENIRAVLSKVLLGEADAGIVYASDIVGGKRNIGILDIPAEINVRASYYIAPVEDASHPDLAAEFIAYLLSQEGKQMLEDHGLFPPE